MAENAAKYFIDTNPIIYFLNGDRHFCPLVMDFFKKHSDCEFYTSTITDSEVYIKIYEKNNFSAAENYEGFLRDFCICKMYVTEAVAKKSARLRNKYPSLKLADALQLSCALEAGCSAFVTNDKRLRQVSELEIVTLEE